MRDGYVVYCYSVSVIVMLLSFLVCWFLFMLLRVAMLVVSCRVSAGGGVGCACCYLVLISCSVLNIGDIVYKHAVASLYLSAYIF
jgi:hypothetical protein